MWWPLCQAAMAIFTPFLSYFFFIIHNIDPYAPQGSDLLSSGGSSKLYSEPYEDEAPELIRSRARAGSGSQTLQTPEEPKSRQGQGTSCVHVRIKAAISIDLACPSTKKHRCQYLWNCLWTSCDVTGSPKAISCDVSGSLHRHRCFFLVGHARPILIAALVCM
jgi:hypothetical protein